MRLTDLMQRSVVSVSPDLTLRELMEILTQQEVSGAPVVTGGVVVGVISTTDIFEFREDAPIVTLRPGGVLDESEGAPRRRAGAQSEFFAESAEPAEIDAVQWMKTTRERDWDLLDEYTVADVMTRDVMSRPSDSSLQGVAKFMLDSGIHRVLVIDEGELKGIVTTTDIVRAVADGTLQGGRTS